MAETISQNFKFREKRRQVRVFPLPSSGKRGRGGVWRRSPETEAAGSDRREDQVHRTIPETFSRHWATERVSKRYYWVHSAQVCSENQQL
ncbi:hypothetical protein AYI68_g1922 [Smittium mucronatum]|uniref:Uncharacterized protein n=1 Tax=Smittium mucronatum TaxID=133383 RepID=A0A1R0H458_9FUNG|nr:hypothetical protein AYI68_g1922 [Smittium mucronatum]